MLLDYDGYPINLPQHIVEHREAVNALQAGSELDGEFTSCDLPVATVVNN